ncbi:hypothetical protein PUN28_001610 [Cardiocondyla obscurior]|uniref:Uncharacterized protein n=1 Tax=Cardiocondyla obscurior TaxID=286306 RepID=A0AAW2GQD7_9HYME
MRFYLNRCIQRPRYIYMYVHMYMYNVKIRYREHVFESVSLRPIVAQPLISMPFVISAQCTLLSIMILFVCLKIDTAHISIRNINMFHYIENTSCSQYFNINLISELFYYARTIRFILV